MESISYSPLKVIAFNSWLENQGVTLVHNCFSRGGNLHPEERQIKSGICLMLGTRVINLVTNVIELVLLPVNAIYAYRDMKCLANRVSRQLHGSWWGVVKIEFLYIRIIVMATIQSLGSIIAPELIYPYFNPLVNRYVGSLFATFLPAPRDIAQQLGIHLDRIPAIEPEIVHCTEEMINAFSLNALDELPLVPETVSVTLDTFSSQLFLPQFLQFLKKHTSLFNVSRAYFEENNPARQSLVLFNMMQVISLHVMGKSTQEIVRSLTLFGGNAQEAARTIDFTALFIRELLLNPQAMVAFRDAWMDHIAHVQNRVVAQQQ